MMNRRKIKGEMMKAVIYARQSSGSDDYSESVENQIENCIRLAAREKLTVIGCYSDLNTSGKTYPEGAEKTAETDAAFQYWFSQQSGSRKFRPGLGKVFRRLEETDFLIVDEMTRLYRPATRSFLEPYVNQKLAENNVQILQCKGGRLDLNQFDQQLIQTLKNQIQDEAIANQKRKSKEQFRKLRDSGYKCNGAKMFGIRYLGNRELEVIPECAEVIRYIYNSIADCMPYSAIIRQVNLKYRHCFRRYCYESNFYAIARQPIYCGFQYNSDHELIPNVQMAGKEIVSFQLWRKVNAILDGKKREAPRRIKKNWLPMSGRLVCGNCGGRLTCQIDRGVVYYICNKNNLSPDPGCSRSRIRFRSSGDVNCLYETVFPLLLPGLAERCRINQENAAARRRIQDRRKKLRILDEKERQLVDLFVENVITRDQMKDILCRHREKRLHLQTEIRISQEIKPETLKYERTVLFPDFFRRIQNRTLPDNLYEQLFRETVRQIVVYDHRADFDTIAGRISIPRIRCGRRNYFPSWEIRPPAADRPEDLFSPGCPPVEIIFFSGREKLLLESGTCIFKEERRE